MRSNDRDVFAAEVANRWREYAAENSLDPDRPTESDLRSFFAQRWPSLAPLGDSAYWHLLLEVLEEHGYQAERSTQGVLH